MTNHLDALTAEPGFSGMRLAAPTQVVLERCPEFDMAVAVTTNATAVMTHIGGYAAPQLTGAPLLLEAGQISLRVHPAALGPALAIDKAPQDRMPGSLQFFDREGGVLHKVFAGGRANDRLLATMKREWGGAGRPMPKPATIEGHDGVLPSGGAAAQWNGRGGIFHLDSLFGDNGLARRAALPARGEGEAWRVQADVLFDFLNLLCNVRMPLTQAVGNRGLMQIHQGPLDGVKRSGSVVLLSSERCSVSFDLTEIEEAWVTRFAGGGHDGYMLELYDWRFHCVAQFSQLGMTGAHVVRYWQDLVHSLPPVRCQSRRMTG